MGRESGWTHLARKSDDVVNLDDLHSELDTYVFADWRQYAVIHAMIDAGAITSIACMYPTCLFETRDFPKKSTRGQRNGLTIDHIVARRHGGSHRVQNLRLAHNACNCQWRKGEIGSYHTSESIEIIRKKALAQHADGRGPNYSDPRRSEKISAALTGKMSDVVTETWRKRKEAQQ